MSAKVLLSITAIITFLGGLAILLVPTALMSPFSLELDAVGIHLARLNGSCSLGLALLLWFARDWTDWEFVRPVAISAFVAFAVAFVVALESTLSGVMNSLGWSNVILDALIALGFGYLLLVKKTS